MNGNIFGNFYFFSAFSGFTFFSATFGVGLYSKIDMISSLCTLMARGAIISMFTVVLVVPAFLMLFDKVIVYSTMGFGEVRKSMKEHHVVVKEHLA